MNRLSISLPAITLALALALPGAALSPATHLEKAKPIAEKTAVTPTNGRFDLMYYWYDVPYGYYNDYATVAQEEWEWYVYTGGIPVDTNPSGGTLVAEGFQTTRSQFPSQYLYAHYPR